MRPPRLELDHVAPRRRTPWPGLALLGLSLAVAAGLAMRYQETAEQLAQVPAKTFSPPARTAPSRTNDAEERIARAALRQLALPWAGLVRALEDAALPDVALLQVQPEAQQQVLRVSAQARSTAAMFRYVRGLTEAKGLSEVHLVSHEVAQDDPQHPVRFGAQASFRAMR